jgi:hypothetical protein
MEKLALQIMILSIPGDCVAAIIANELLIRHYLKASTDLRKSKSIVEWCA